MPRRFQPGSAPAGIFCIEVDPRLGSRGSRSARAGFVLAALEQVLHERRPLEGGPAQHGDRGVQYVSIRRTERPADTDIAPSVGSVGDSNDNALAETIIGLFKAEAIRRAGPRRGIEGVEFATLEWLDRFNHHGLLEPIGHMPPAEAEAEYYATHDILPLAA